ncbi:MAG: hypothetical protein GOP50_12645 [Candidatus Heimdallarchaeota archaeon]|nr:hypothetical protein [Candidatus Heimdallarchaeota archaeon]
MVILSRKKLIFSLFSLILIGSFLISPAQAQENEDLLYLTDTISDGGVLESEVIIDGNGNLHTFMIVKNSNGTRLVHLYYIEGVMNFDVIEESAQGVHLFISYVVGTKAGIVYSIDIGPGAKDFRVYEKQDSYVNNALIFHLTSELATWYVDYYKFLFEDGLIHGFHNHFWGGDMQFMNITHYYGPPSGTILSESFFIADSNTKSAIDIVIDEFSNLWYIYELRQDDYGIGIGELDDLSYGLIPVATRIFSGVLYDVPKFMATSCDPVDGLLQFVFVNPYKLFWGYFNGISIAEDVQSTFYIDPIDFEFNIDDTATSVLVLDLVDDNILNLYHFTLTGISWGVQSIQSDEKILEDQYSVFLEGVNFVVIFSTNINTNPYGPDSPLAFREKTGLALFVLANIILETELYIESLEVYNPIIEFFVTKWWVLVIIGGILVILGLILWVALKRRKKEIHAFLTDTQVGENKSRFALLFLNIGRLIRNGFSTIFTIWLSNKKRSILTLAGFIITGYLLSSAVIIAQSEESAMIKAFDKSFPLIADGEISARLETSFITGNYSLIQPSYGTDARNEILDLYHGLTVDNYIEDLLSGYRTIVRVYKTFGSADLSFVGLPDGCDEFLDTMLVSGRLPINDTEVLITDALSTSTGVDINETLTIGGWADFWVGWTGAPADEDDYKINCTVVGIFERISVGQAKRVSEHLGVPYDIYTIASENAEIITIQDNFFEILSNGNKMHLGMWGYYQLLMNFDEFSITDRATLVEEQDEMQQKIYTFSFDPSSTISTQVIDELNDEETTELKLFFESFNAYYLNNMARLLIFAIPAILLSIFMVFESSDLFSSSYEQEMEILRNRGISTGRLFSMYLIIRLAEIIVASLASFGIAIGTAIPLIKIDGFISFTNTDTHLVIGNIPTTLGMIAGVLFIVSVPRILILVRRKRKIEKAPRIARMKIKKEPEPTFDIPKDEIIVGESKTAGKSLADGYTEKETETTITSVLNYLVKSKLLSWRDIFFLGLGIGLFYFFFNRAFIAFDTQAVDDFTIYLFLTIAGAIFTLIGGLPFAVKLLGLIQRSISALVWRYKKSRFSFSLAEIGKDIRHFENITLIFLLVVLIIVPVLVVPYSKETTLTEQAYFMNGTDIRLMNWDDVDIISVNDLDSIPQIRSYTHIEEYTLYGGDYDHARLLVVNVTDFMKTMTVPSASVTTLDWNLIALLNESNILISNPMKTELQKPIGGTLDFEYLSNIHTMTILGNFNLFPVFYSNWDLYNEEHMMIISTEAFEIIDPIVNRRLKFKDEIFIRTYYEKDAQVVVDKLYAIEQGLTVDTMSEVKSKLKTPLYNIFIIEMLLSLFVATGVLIFSTFTTAIKILEKRVIKHDIMKKMGINSSKIISMSTVQTMLAAIGPALAIGAIVGFNVIGPVLKQLNYGAVPYKFYINYPYIMISVLFVGIPLLIYLSLNYFLKKEFGKYAPTMME